MEISGDRTELAIKAAQEVGGRVFPCVRHTKVPRIEQYIQRARGDEIGIRNLWAKGRMSNIGLVCGERFWVLDIDPRNNGHKLLKMLQSRFAPLPATPIVETNEGGRHYYFSTENVGNFGYHHAPFGNGIEVNGPKRYVMAVGSTHESGHLYRWLETPPQPIKFALAPEWLLELVRKPLIEERVSTPTNGGNGYYVRAALRSEALRLSNEVCGRNQALHDASFRMAMYTHEGLTKDEVWASLLYASEINGYVHKDGETAAVKTFESGWRNGVLYPRDVPNSTLK